VVDRLAGYGRRLRFGPGHGPLSSVREVLEQARLMDDLREHAERMMSAGATVDEAERRYEVPDSYREYDMLSWGATVGGAMRAYFAALPCCA
jgi:hypothetical protein